MAARSGKKRGTKKKTTTNPNDNSVSKEIFIWVTLAVSILLMLSVFGVGGFIGKGIGNIMDILFGYMSYIFPFFLFLWTAFLISNMEDKRVYLKLTVSAVLFVFVCTFCALIFDEGGVIGAFLQRLLVPAFGKAGTYVILIISILIGIVLLSGKSLLKPLKQNSQKAYTRAKTKVTAPRKPKEPKAANLKRVGTKAQGVSFDTTLKTEQQTTPPIIELEVPEEEPVKVEEPKKKVKKAKTVRKPLIDKPEEIVLPDVKLPTVAPNSDYHFPSTDLLKKARPSTGESDNHLQETANKLEQILQNFGVNVTVTDVSSGPSVTRYELQPEMGVKVSKIVGLADDIKLNLAAPDIRIEAPIPGKAAVGIEVANKTTSMVSLRELIESKEFSASSSKIAFGVGKDIGGKIIIADIAKMPHVLIAGATGSGKSVCINTLIMSILFRASPDEVKFLMIDPKVVELSVYNGIPHLLHDVVTDPKKAANTLNWAVVEMQRRYQEFAKHQVRDMKGYNKLAESDEELKKMYQLVIIVDELADLMMVASNEVEEAIIRLAQLARAAGIHLVIATQRPSVNVITGLIKANMPSRIALSVTSGVDSRTIIDMNGAEKLLGNGDMLFYPQGYQKPVRVQGAYVSDKEVQQVVEYLKNQSEEVVYDTEIQEAINTSAIASASIPSSSEEEGNDAYFKEAGLLIIEKEKASIGMLQRNFKIGFNRAARIMDQLHSAGVVGGEEGTKPRKILMNAEEFNQYMEEQQ
ncbi:S-DNA-T family DNA segregation ATPase FtsK/SpoIIIE [Aequitasia blattaphilus]|uniref:DNA translocase FtsK n=1 Tax=Aequitasia blattaphilus TaxID=2949332 RepID=A0ABT1E761_9FIRM|nr:DNA translocase FtsK [Aequitasia blattaphilus]MCP1101670.1 DNA translocase FtsK [Aequitasia blattaphilus]MCR8614310.1 DNA translocase FtsK [Aequitasia blattaphilus]